VSPGGGLLSQIAGSLGGAPAAAAIVAGGLVVGAVTGGVASSGVFPGGSATSNTQLAVYPCPDTGPVLFTVPSGQKFLVTGRTEDSSWLRIHNPLPGRSEAWIQTDPVTLKGALADVPVAECVPEVAALATVFPEPSLTAIQDNSPSPSPTPAPTPAPVANAKPGLTSLTASTGTISYDTKSYCPSAVKKVTFKVKATDSEGIASVALWWRSPGSDTFVSSPMTRATGSAKSGTWQAALDTTANGITKAGKLAFYAVATDTAGATRRLPTKGSDSITVAVCVNTGPAIKSAASSAGKTLFQVTRSAPNCRSTTTISATVTDVDGVDTVTLFFRPPGEATYRSRPMSLANGKWSAPIDTTADKITIPNPPTGNLRWYIKAVDKTGLASQTNAVTITIRRCDTEATFGQPSLSPTPMCPSRATTFYISASDPDGIAGSSAYLVYTYRRTDGTTKTVRKQMAYSDQAGSTYLYLVNVQPGAAGRLTRTFVPLRTRDQYDGSEGPSSTTPWC
jgi:hypothetical protein